MKGKNAAYIVSDHALVFLILLILTVSCGKPEAKQQDQKHMKYRQNLMYNLREADETYLLPGKMKEISGLTKAGKDKLFFLNDEDGKVFGYDLKQKKIMESFKFWKKGDFEGVELVGNRVYTLQSDGDLISFEIKKEEASEIRKEETPLSTNNDTEGLGYDPLDKVLLIACKEDGGYKGNDQPGRVVYAYDPAKKDFNKNPVIQIRWEQVRDFLKSHDLDIFINDSRKFKPSAVAVNPVDKNYYVLSTTGKSLLVFDRNGELILYYTVPRKILEQPEGICFDSNGDMYLSSEGVDEDPRVVKFKMKSL